VNDIAQSYALSLRSGEYYKIDWDKIDAAIAARWGTKSLQRIKNKAWSGKCFATQNRD
jgi:hypothetical protein